MTDREVQMVADHRASVGGVDIRIDFISMKQFKNGNKVCIKESAFNPTNHLPSDRSQVFTITSIMRASRRVIIEADTGASYYTCPTEIYHKDERSKYQ